MHVQSSQLKRSQLSGAPEVSAIQCLMARLIDYASLFPPASLSMREAIANYDAYLRSEHSWMLGRFIVPASRLIEFREALIALPVGGIPVDWELSVLIGADAEKDLESVDLFDRAAEDLSGGIGLEIKSVEARASNAAEVRRLDSLIPGDVIAYFEVPINEELVAAVAECSGRRLKARTGGETPDKFPSPEAILQFLRASLRADVPFKATAGLHHPLRSVHRLTYQPDSPSGLMHGFLNVFLAASFLKRGMDEVLVLELLNEQSPLAFRFDLDGVSWREHRLTARDLFLARREFAISFGSCSFIEPIEDLRTLRLL
jgi:hypothetical protein